MSQSKLIRLTPEVRADFAAYLDGELEPAATERIEAVLAQSEVARKDLEELVGAYELLDVLPRYRALSEFTGQTLETIRLDELPRDYRSTRWYQWLQTALPLVGWILALLGITISGYLATHRGIRTGTDRLLQDLPVVEQADLYSEIGTAEFLKRLAADDALLDELRPQGEEVPGVR
jgi:hypothetical protein